MGWLEWLRKSPAPVIDHPLFGRVRAAHRPREGSWMWETLADIATPHGPADVTFDAGEDGPNAAHERQWEKILVRLDDYTRIAAPMIATELQGWEVPFDQVRPWDELIWQGANLAGDTAPSDMFELGYGCRNWPDALITIGFEDDHPAFSRLDD